MYLSLKTPKGFNMNNPWRSRGKAQKQSNPEGVEHLCIQNITIIEMNLSKGLIIETLNLQLGLFNICHIINVYFRL